MDCRVKPGNDEFGARRANQLDRFLSPARFHDASQPPKTRAPINDFREPHQADLACPVPLRKIFLFRFFGN
jgi:hypothetical protein